MASECLEIKNKLDSLSDNSKSINKSKEILGDLKSMSSDPSFYTAITSGIVFDISESIGKRIASSATKKSLTKAALGSALKSIGGSLNIASNVAMGLDLVNQLILNGKWTKYPNMELIKDTFTKFDEEFSKEPAEPSKDVKECIRNWAFNTLKPTVKKEQGIDLQESVIEDIIKDIIDAFKVDLSAKVQKFIPDEIDPKTNEDKCMPIFIELTDTMEMALPSEDCPAELYRDIFKQYMTDNYPEIKLIEPPKKEKFSFFTNKMNDMYVRYAIGGASSDLVSKSIKEASEKAIKEASEKAIKEASEKAIKEASEKAIKEASEKGLKEASEKAIKEASEKNIREGAEKFIKNNPKFVAAGLTAGGLAIYAASTGKSIGEAAGELAGGITSEVASNLNDAACKATGICPSDTINNIARYAKIAGIGFIVVIILMLLIWSISKFV